MWCIKAKTGRASEADRRRGFTLIEMLTVVGIIMLLAGLILSGLNVARDRARVVRARRDVAQLVTAWNMYYADYASFPTIGSMTNGQIVTGQEVVQILRGRGGAFVDQNPRQIHYMDFHEKTTQFPDPWGGLYRIAWDDDYDGQLTAHGETLRLSLVVWSAGPDGKDGTKDERKDDVLSWRAK